MSATAMEQERAMTDHKNSMKAIVHPRYGRPDVLELREVDKPGFDDDQVLVRVHASSVNPIEWYGVTGPYFARIGWLRTLLIPTRMSKLLAFVASVAGASTSKRSCSACALSAAAKLRDSDWPTRLSGRSMTKVPDASLSTVLATVLASPVDGSRIAGTCPPVTATG